MRKNSIKATSLIINGIDFNERLDIEKTLIYTKIDFKFWSVPAWRDGLSDVSAQHYKDMATLSMFVQVM